MSVLDIEIGNLEKALNNIVKFSYESEIYNTELGIAIEQTRWHIGQNIEHLKESNKVFGGV